MASEMPDFPSQIGLVNENPLPAPSLVTASPVVSSVMPSPPPASLERNSLTATDKMLPRSINTISELPSSPSASVSPAVASSSSLYPQISTASGMSHLPSQASPANLALDSSDVTSSAFPSQRRAPVPALETSLGENSVPGTYRTSSECTNMSSKVPSSSMNPDFEFVDDPKKILGSSLREAKQKARPWKAACSLVRLFFLKETLVCSAVVTGAQGHSTLDPNKIAAIRESLTTYFPTYDLSEDGRDWKTCITSINKMISYLRNEKKTQDQKSWKGQRIPLTLQTHQCV